MKHSISIVFLSLFIVSAANAQGFAVGVFGSDTDFDNCCSDAPAVKDESSAGVYFEHTRGDTIIYGAEVFLANDHIGLTFKGGANVLGGRLTAGAGFYDDEVTKDLNVAGVFAPDTHSSFVPVYYVEYEYSGVFVRASRIESSIDLQASRQTGVDGFGNPVYSGTSETVKTTDNWLWLGYRFQF